MRGRGRKGAQNWPARALVRLGLLLAALALFSQSLALAAPPMAAHRDARAAQAQLSAVFGPGVVICAQADDPGAPASPDCHDSCPICQAVAQTALYAAPAPALLTTPPFSLSEVLGAKQPLRGPPTPPLAFALARGPPAPT